MKMPGRLDQAIVLKQKNLMKLIMRYKREPDLRDPSSIRQMRAVVTEKLRQGLWNNKA